MNLWRVAIDEAIGPDVGPARAAAGPVPGRLGYLSFTRDGAQAAVWRPYPAPTRSSALGVRRRASQDVGDATCVFASSLRLFYVAASGRRPPRGLHLRRAAARTLYTLSAPTAAGCAS